MSSIFGDTTPGAFGFTPSGNVGLGAGNSKAGAVVISSFAAIFASPVISVVVGSAKKEYNLHEGVLILKVPYFASLLRSGLQEARSRSVVLSTNVDREDAFEKFIEYLYQGDYCVPEDIATACILHARVHTLADRLCIDELKNSSTQKLQKLLFSAYQSSIEPGFGGFGSTQTGRKSRISVDTIVSLASIIYNNTIGLQDNITKFQSFGSPQRSGFNSGASSRRALPGDCRQIVSRYTASHWSIFKLDKKMKEFMDENTDFAYDVLFSTGDGKPL